MIHARSLVIAAACVFAPVGLVVASGLSPASPPMTQPRPPEQPAAKLGPHAAEPLQHTHPDEPLTGLLLPRESADVGAAVAGRLIAVHVRMGDRVREGQPIATLDTRLADADVAAAQAAVRSQEVEQALARGAARAASEHEARVRALDEHGLTAGEELVRAREESEQAGLRAQANSSLLSQRMAQLQRLSLERHLMQVRAPFPGVIAVRYLDPGAAVSGAGSQPIVRVISEALLLRVALPEAQAGRLRSGARLAATSLVGGQRVTARVERVAAEVDPVARVWMIEASIEAAATASSVEPLPVTSGLEMRVVAIGAETR